MFARIAQSRKASVVTLAVMVTIAAVNTIHKLCSSSNNSDPFSENRKMLQPEPEAYIIPLEKGQAPLWAIRNFLEANPDVKKEFGGEKANAYDIFYHGNTLIKKPSGVWESVKHNSSYGERDPLPPGTFFAIFPNE